MKLNIVLDLDDAWGEDCSSLIEILKGTVEAEVRATVRRIVSAETKELAKGYVAGKRKELLAAMDEAIRDIDLHALLGTGRK